MTVKVVELLTKVLVPLVFEQFLSPPLPLCPPASHPRSGGPAALGTPIRQFGDPLAAHPKGTGQAGAPAFGLSSRCLVGRRQEQEPVGQAPEACHGGQTDQGQRIDTSPKQQQVTAPQGQGGLEPNIAAGDLPRPQQEPPARQTGGGRPAGGLSGASCRRFPGG